MATNRTRSSRVSNRTSSSSRNSSRRNTSSDGFGNSALANQVRSAISSSNRTIANRSSGRSDAPDLSYLDMNGGGARDLYNQQRQQRSTINSNDLINTGSINLPNPPEIPNYSGMIQGNNAGLATLGGITMDASGQLVLPPTQTGQNTATQSGSTPGTSSSLQNLLTSLGIMPKKESVYDDAEYQKQQKRVERSRQELNNYTSNLNSIVTKSQAESLALEGQGRGITESIIGGQQAQISREAAIQALPVQAQIAAAQGNLDMAERQLNQVYQIKSEQLANEYEYKTNQYNAIKEYLTKEEERRLAKLDLEETRTYNESQRNADAQDEWARTALANGRPELISSIHGLDPKSPQFRQQLAKIQSRMIPVGAGSGEIPTIKTINGTDYQWEPMTQSWIKPETPTGGVSTTPGFESGKTMEETQMEFQNLEQAFDSIRAIAADYEKDVFQLELSDIKKFSNADMDTVGKSLAIIQNPQLEKVGGEAANALDPTGIGGKIRQGFRQTFLEKKYNADDVYDAVLQARKQYKQKVAKFGYAVTPEGYLVPITQ